MSPGRDDFGTLVGRFARYCVVGAIDTTIHFSGTIALVEGAHVGPVPASSAAFVATVLVSFVLNRRWVFTRHRPTASSLVCYAIVSGTGFVLNVAIMAFTTEWLAWRYIYGLALVVLIVPITNFTLNSRWTFRSAS